jgi:uncharacterized protein
MFRPMRREKQLLPEAETIAILESCTSGVLAAHGDDDYPYAVPLSFAYDDGKLYFHSAVQGHLLDALERNDKAAFCIIAADDVSPDKLTTLFRSVIAFGKARMVTDDDEKRLGLMRLAEKYSPSYLDAARTEIDSRWERMSVIVLDIEHLTGKASLSLVKRPHTQ